MGISSRRAFLGRVGQGMLFASAGPALGFERAWGRPIAWSQEDTRLDFGAREPLVALMQDTEPDEMLRQAVLALGSGASLRELTAAAALANARTFGGEDYVGYHAFMALVPAFEMSRQLSEELRALPVLKVLHRNTSRMRAFGGSDAEVLGPLASEEAAADPAAMRRAMLATDAEAAERAFAGYAARAPAESFAALQHSVLYDVTDVHRTVLAWRAWDLRRLCGEEHGHTLLRQSLRYCVDVEAARVRRGREEPHLRAFLPALLEDSGVARREPGQRRLDDGALESLAQAVYSSDAPAAARAAAAALLEGVAHEDVGEALSIAATRLLLNDPGRSDAAEGKPRGSVHGASTGVHASDAAAAWRQIARVSEPHDATVALIVGAYHTGGQSGHVGSGPLPHGRELEELERGGAPEDPLRALAEAIENRDQPRAMAAAELHAARGGAPADLFDLVIDYAVRADGALHAEKYFRTVNELVGWGRPAFRRDHMKALARVSASSFGFEAEGLELARELLSS